MRISLKAITFSMAIVWGLVMLVIGLVHLADPSYGAQFLRLMSSVYPGVDAAPTLGHVLLGTAYGFADGAIAGLIFGLLYRGLTHKTASPK